MVSILSELKRINRSRVFQQLLSQQLSHQQYLNLASLCVPQSILDCAVAFADDVDSYDYEIPTELREKYGYNYPSQLIYLEWNESVKSWIDDFTLNWISKQGVSSYSFDLVHLNVSKAIACYTIENSYLE